MQHFQLSCVWCHYTDDVHSMEAVVQAVVDHLRLAHPSARFPQPALSLVRVDEYSTLDYIPGTHAITVETETAGQLPASTAAPTAIEVRPLVTVSDFKLSKE